MLTKTRLCFTFITMNENDIRPLEQKRTSAGSRNAEPDAYVAPARCPVCGDAFRIERLRCAGCQSALEGSFTLGRLGRLSREQLQFVEVFIKSRGTIKDVEAALGVSYPTVVARLNDVVAAMGFEPRPEDGRRSARRAAILDELAAGAISPAEAAARLRAM